MALNIEQIYASLPDVMADEGELDVVLRRMGRVPDYDNAKVSALRTIVFYNKLVVQAQDGRLVKGELPTPQSFAEAETERMASLAAEERRRRELLFPAENYVNPMRVETEKFILEVVSGLINALEQQVSELQEQVDFLIRHEIAA
jgi:hypothetical protein